jgi:leucyl aminopeptidase (aminopeptidase T)
MKFDLKKFFGDVFAPQSGDVVTVMYDLPHGEIRDTEEWQARRLMAEEWHEKINAFSADFGITVHPMVTYLATGSHNANMPDDGMWKNRKTGLEDIIKGSTILISMPEFSASAPLAEFAKKYANLRAASMPMVKKSMEQTALSADYREVAAVCARLAPLFESSDSIEVTFSTDHLCLFDISDHKRVIRDTGMLHPGTRHHIERIANLPAGEVAIVPNESEQSRSAGNIPAVIDGEMIVKVIKANRIIDVVGDGPFAEKKRREFANEKALCNIAEVAVGCNSKAVVTGNVLEDEKAGFHWAYGRSDHMGGKVGIRDFSSPDKAYHKDIVYARGNPIVCKRLDFISSDGERITGVIDGELVI